MERKKTVLKARSAKSRTAKRKVTKSSSTTAPLASIKNELQKYKKLFSENKPGTLSFQPKCQKHPIVLLMSQAEDLLFENNCSEQPTESIQEDVIKKIEQSGIKNIRDQYLEARESARAVLFDLYVKQIDKYFEQEAKLKKALYRALLIDNPSVLYSSDEVRDYVTDGIVSKGSEFLKKLSDDFKNAERRSLRLPIDFQAYLMAANWTNPHCPLWLMERPAIFKACSLLHPGIMTLDSLGKRLKSKGLEAKSDSHFKRSAKPLIIDVEEHKNSKTIAAYVVRGTIFDDLNGKKYPYSFCRKKTLTDKELKAEKAEEKERQTKLAADLKNLQMLGKQLGEGTDDFMEALKQFASSEEKLLVQGPSYQLKVKKMPPKSGHQKKPGNRQKY